mmetsp:Transcript_72718/g.132892  ORF Transcript_72718/g.132892 Transcript_72718/m.132892 type:complete len:204 (+) Transcript_72718:1311-1922(+)
MWHFNNLLHILYLLNRNGLFDDLDFILRDLSDDLPDLDLRHLNDILHDIPCKHFFKPLNHLHLGHRDLLCNLLDLWVWHLLQQLHWDSLWHLDELLAIGDLWNLDGPLNNLQLWDGDLLRHWADLRLLHFFSHDLHDLPLLYFLNHLLTHLNWNFLFYCLWHVRRIYDFFRHFLVLWTRHLLSQVHDVNHLRHFAKKFLGGDH